MRASTPSDTTSAAFDAKSDGISAWYVWSCWYAVQIVASSSAAFLSSRTASGSPFTKRTMSGRRVRRFSTTANWLTASQSLAVGSSKSMTRTCAPRIVPSAARYSTVTPFTSIRCTPRLRWMRSAPSGRVTLR